MLHSVKMKLQLMISLIGFTFMNQHVFKYIFISTTKTIIVVILNKYRYTSLLLKRILSQLVQKSLMVLKCTRYFTTFKVKESIMY